MGNSRNNHNNFNLRSNNNHRNKNRAQRRQFLKFKRFTAIWIKSIDELLKNQYGTTIVQFIENMDEEKLKYLEPIIKFYKQLEQEMENQ